ncbi:MAG TPA: hypothetical protein VMU09_02080 [Acidimicrobiales bacterium]|nr:hypothetical protein [Acidimicrobiales bacterium]
MARPAKITRDDLETKLRQIAGEVDDRVEDAKPNIVAGAVVVVVVVALVAYLLGRRGGRLRSAVVEIRRV